MTKSPYVPKASKAGSVFFSILFGMIFIVFFFLFTGLGIWQVQRLGWKTGLIARVEERVHRQPVAAPARADWPGVTAGYWDYRPVRITGHFLNDREVLVSALTSYGSGYWLLTPFKTADGAITFINRGFVPMDNKAAERRAAGQIEGEATVTGLLRMGEGNGFFFRNNNPETNRWYTRELPAMAKARGLPAVAPYFIDADKTPNAGGVPIGGLTVVRFPNSHLAYAVTWFLLAGGVVAAAVFVILNSRKKRKAQEGGSG